MFVAETVTIRIEEVDMTINTAQPLTLGWAIGLSAALFVSALGVAAGTYALIHSELEFGVQIVQKSSPNTMLTIFGKEKFVHRN